MGAFSGLRPEGNKTAEHESVERLLRLGSSVTGGNDRQLLRAWKGTSQGSLFFYPAPSFPPQY